MVNRIGRRCLLLLCLFSIASFCYSAEPKPLTYLDLLQRTVDIETLYRAPDFTVEMASSYDRQGGDLDDRGYIRKEGDWYVIAEMQGPGAVSRIWSLNPSGLIRIYIDEGSSPKLQTDFDGLFSGKTKPFVKPFVHAPSDKNGPHWSYVPVPFSNFCKIAVQELGCYQIEFKRFSSATLVKSFDYPPSRRDDKPLAALGKKFRASPQPPYQNSRQIEEYSISHSIAAGDRIDMTTLDGPAVIRGIRLLWQGGRDESGRDLVLRCYWEGEKTPSVIVPLYDFFGGGVQTMIVGQEKSGWRYCYFPMPFHKSARIEIENSSERDVYTFDLLLSLQRKVELPSPLRTFHAWWTRDNETPVRNLNWNEGRGEFLSRGDENFLALSTSGPGHLVGWGMQADSFADSDVVILTSPIYGPPAFSGTGHHGFFDSSAKPASADWPLAGAVSGSTLNPFLFRSFLAAPIDFGKGVHVTLEHGSGNTLRKDYASALFWYQENPHKLYSRILPAGARRFRTAPLPQPTIEWNEGGESIELPFEAESLPVNAVLGIYDSQDMFPLGPNWSDNQQMRFDGFERGASIVFDLPPLDFSGWRRLRCRTTGEPDGAMVSIRVNGFEVRSQYDMYHERPVSQSVDCDRAVFLHAAERPRAQFTVSGKNENSDGLVVGVDSFQWLVPKTTPGELELLGPFGVPGDQERTAPYTMQIVDRDHLFLGFTFPGAKEPKATKIAVDPKDGAFRLGGVLSENQMEKGLCLLTWNASVERAGIYRFELEPAETVPFLFREDSGRMVPQNHRLLINNIVLLGKDRMRYDPVERRILPQRYRIPLQKGNNRLSWLVRCNAETAVRPVLYGLHANDRSKK